MVPDVDFVIPRGTSAIRQNAGDVLHDARSLYSFRGGLEQPLRLQHLDAKALVVLQRLLPALGHVPVELSVTKRAASARAALDKRAVQTAAIVAALAALAGLAALPL